MGAKKPKAKKGPKGKKARAKAKLEQVWGEHVDEEARQASKFRKGKSRLTASSATASENNNGSTKQQQQPNGKKHVKEKEVDPLSRNRRGLKSSFESFLERKDSLYQREEQQRLKQRQFAQSKKHHNRRYNNAVNSMDSSDDDDDSADEEMGRVDVNGGSLSHLLNRISGTKKSSSLSARNNKIAAESDDDDESIDSSGDVVVDSDDDTESGSSESSSSQQYNSDDSMDVDNDDEVEDDLVDLLPKGIAEDLYETHFSKSPLPQLMDTTEHANLMKHLTKSSKVNTTSVLSSSLQVHLSGPTLDSWNSITTAAPNETKPKQLWKAFAKGPQQHVRQVLSRNWNTVNRSALKRNQRERSENENSMSFSSLQQVLYPVISSYADILITNESRQVSRIHHYICSPFQLQL